MALTRRDALSLLLASLPAALLAGCGGGGGDNDSDNTRSVYLALGDSYAYGYTTQGGTPTGLGDIGYVRPFADSLATRNDGVRPTVLNLAIPGETTTSFLRSVNGTPALPYNQNYAATNSPSQSMLMDQRTASLSTDGKRIRWITLQIGGNDLLHLLVDPTFQAASSSQQQAIISSTLTTMRANLRSILIRLRSIALEAQILVLGYPDPFVGLGAANPIGDLSTPLARQLNTIISEEAAAISSTFIDVFTAFQGQETTYTLITTEDPPGSGIPDFHPSPAGYTRIGELLPTYLG